MSEWISVKDIPELNGKYLCYNGRDIDFVYFEDGYFLMCIFPMIRFDFDKIPFSHWMPLPNPPNDEDENISHLSMEEMQKELGETLIKAISTNYGLTSDNTSLTDLSGKTG